MAYFPVRSRDTAVAEVPWPMRSGRDRYGLPAVGPFASFPDKEGREVSATNSLDLPRGCRDQVPFFAFIASRRFRKLVAGVYRWHFPQVAGSSS